MQEQSCCMSPQERNEIRRALRDLERRVEALESIAAESMSGPLPVALAGLDGVDSRGQGADGFTYLRAEGHLIV